jgi:hypothetical protein
MIISFLWSLNIIRITRIKAAKFGQVYPFVACFLAKLGVGVEKLNFPTTQIIFSAEKKDFLNSWAFQEH